MKKAVLTSRKGHNKSTDPTFCIIDSQSIKITSASEKQGDSGRKKIKEQRQHIAIDSFGYILHVDIHKANIHSTKAGYKLIQDATKKDWGNN
jgi:hypothetical protein